MVFKTLSHELRKFGYKTTVVGPDEPEIEKQMTDSAIDFIVSEGLTQSHHIIRNSVTSYIGRSFSGVKVAPSAQMFTKFCDYLLNDSALIETLRKSTFVAAVIDTPLLNLCSSVFPYRLSIPFIHFGRIFEHQERRTWINPEVYPATCILAISDKMSYLERVSNSLIYIRLMTFPDMITPSDLVGKYVPEMPHLTN